jgi:hypothetical protein
MTERVLEAWEFGDPVEVVARREAVEAGKRKASAQLLRHKRRRIKALVKQVMAKARVFI